MICKTANMQSLQPDVDVRRGESCIRTAEGSAVIS